MRDGENCATTDLSPSNSAFMFICYVMIDIETMGWRGWFLWLLTFLGIYFKKLAIGCSTFRLRILRRAYAVAKLVLADLLQPIYVISICCHK
jgi:hypothetical protein